MRNSVRMLRAAMVRPQTGVVRARRVCYAAVAASVRGEESRCNRRKKEVEIWRGSRRARRKRAAHGAEVQRKRERQQQCDAQRERARGTRGGGARSAAARVSAVRRGGVQCAVLWRVEIAAKVRL